MSIEYDNYIRDHVTNVVKAFDWLTEHFQDICEKMMGARYSIGTHDYSKWSVEEYEPYDDYFYGGNRSYAVKEAFDKAWLHHIHNNPHHWQHWILVEDDAKRNEYLYRLLEMPYHDVIEMICDWWAFSWKSGNLYEIFDWYDAHSNIMLHPDTKKLVDDILGRIRTELDKERDE